MQKNESTNIWMTVSERWSCTHLQHFKGDKALHKRLLERLTECQIFRKLGAYCTSSKNGSLNMVVKHVRFDSGNYSEKDVGKSKRNNKKENTTNNHMKCKHLQIEPIFLETKGHKRLFWHIQNKKGIQKFPLSLRNIYNVKLEIKEGTIFLRYPKSFIIDAIENTILPI